MTSYPPYKPDGAWSSLLDLIRCLERPGAWDEAKYLANASDRLAHSFELMPDCRARDVGRLLHALAMFLAEMSEPEESEPPPGSTEIAPGVWMQDYPPGTTEGEPEAWSEDEPLADSDR